MSKKRHILTESEKAFITKNYSEMASWKIAQELKLKISSVYNFAFKNQLKKSEEFQKSPISGRFKKGCKLGSATSFKKGNIPFNKGKKMSTDLRAKIEPTMFKKGNKPHNRQENGTIRNHFDKSGKQYLEIKISDGNWQMLHRHIWEQKNGIIPKGMKLAFIDGNSLNVKIENLMLISSRDLMLKNSHVNLTPELYEVVKMKNKLIKKIKEHGQKQN